MQGAGWLGVAGWWLRSDGDPRRTGGTAGSPPAPRRVQANFSITTLIWSSLVGGVLQLHRQRRPRGAPLLPQPLDIGRADAAVARQALAEAQLERLRRGGECRGADDVGAVTDPMRRRAGGRALPVADRRLE